MPPANGVYCSLDTLRKPPSQFPFQCLTHTPPCRPTQTPFTLKLSHVLHCPQRQIMLSLLGNFCRKFSKGKGFKRQMNKKWEGIFFSPAYYRICMGTVVGFSIGVRGGASAENKFSAFLALQNTSGQVPVKR